MTSYALLFCLGLAESIPAENGYQHAAPSTPTPSRFVSPDFVLQLRVSENATATLFAYKRAPHLAAPASPLDEQRWTPAVGEEEGAEWDDDDDDGRIRSELSFDQYNNYQTYQLQQLKHFSVQPSSATGEDYYDGKGAMYFAIAVILFYGISIAMLVAASTLRRSHTDYELKGFLRSYARIDEERRSREKQKVRMVLQQKNLLHMLPGCSAAGNAVLLASATSPNLQQLQQQQQQVQRLQRFKRQLLRRQEESALPNLDEEQQSLSSEEQPPVQQLQREEQQQTERCKNEERDNERRVASQQRQQQRCLRVSYRVTDGSTTTEPEVDSGERPKVDEIGSFR